MENAAKEKTSNSRKVLQLRGGVTRGSNEDPRWRAKCIGTLKQRTGRRKRKGGT